MDSRCVVVWKRASGSFVNNRYDRSHEWQFDGGVVVPASSSPEIVPPPMSNERNVNPEEAFVAALASCHMLWFLGIAARDGWVVNTYRDQATGTLARGSDGKMAMTTVLLRPHVRFGASRRPTDGDVQALHESAHHECFLASSVKTTISVEPTWSFEAVAEG